MNPVGVFASGSDTGLAGLKIWSSGKKKAHVNSVYSYSLSFKKPKMSVAGNVINLSVGFLSLEDIGNASVKPVMS
ncbi:hypothetical protein G9A89_008343 [Geosiphon pyriformis]|nr:hypothetical protein G9A89_008343 [Geosiphon pyriformis]